MFQWKFFRMVPLLHTFDDSFVGIGVDEIHYEMCKIVVEIVHDMDILKNSHLDIVSTVYPLDHN